MDKSNKFYVDNSQYTRVKFTILLIILVIPYLLCLIVAFESFEFKLLSIFAWCITLFCLLMFRYRTKSYIEIWDENIVVYRPKRRYSFKFVKYTINYNEIRRCFFNRIRNLYFRRRGIRSWGFESFVKYRYLFLIEKTNGEYLFLARNDISEKWTRGWPLWNNNLGDFKKLNDQLNLKGIKLYDKTTHNHELELILKNNIFTTRMWHAYKQHYLSR